MDEEPKYVGLVPVWLLPEGPDWTHGGKLYFLGAAVVADDDPAPAIAFTTFPIYFPERMERMRMERMPLTSGLSVFSVCCFSSSFWSMVFAMDEPFV
ncbi:hypothetical protein AGMMS49990_04900 [Endomicrobiia bacterium]|nr:hypothetical protein AGMMS49990_04900 [Endomicrobiia bacterium]